MAPMLGPNPFVGPRPFEPGEPIFGRDREIKDLYYLLTADRIVVLHSPSGAGKSSLIQAGLIPRLEPAFDIWGPTRVNLLPGAEGNHFVLSTILGFEEKIPERLRRTPQSLSGQTLAEYFAGRPRRRSAPPDTVLIFDQFEEILTVNPLAVGAKEEFFDQLGELLRNPTVWALFILREDYLAPLAPYAQRVPTQLQNRFRIDLLKPEQAKQVMVELARIGGRQFPAATQLAADLSRVKVQQADGSFREEIGQHIEPVQLQVVCRRLWDEMPPEDLSIDADNLEQFADVDEALGAYYAASVHKIANPQARAEDAARPDGPTKSLQATKPAETSDGKSERGDRRRPFGVTFLALFNWLVSLAILRQQPTLEFATFPWDWLWTAIGVVGIWAGFAVWRSRASALLAQSLFVASGLLSFLGMLFAYYLSAPRIGTSYEWNRANLLASIVVFLMPMVMMGLLSVFYLRNQQTRRARGSSDPGSGDPGSGDTGHQRLSLVRLLAVNHLAFGIGLLLWSIQPIEALITKIPVALYKEMNRDLTLLARLLGVGLIRSGIGIWRCEKHSSWIAVAFAALTIPGSAYTAVAFWNLSRAEVLLLGSMVQPVGFFVLTTAILFREHRKGDGKKPVSTGNLGVERARERAIRDWMGERLITAGGVRGQVLSEPEQSGGLDNIWISQLLDTHLVRSEKRAGATWYELAHDRLIEPIRRENARWQEARLSALQSAAKIWGDHGRPPGMLLQAEELRKGELWAEENLAWMTETEGDFLAASRTARRHQRWLRGLMIGALLLAIVALGASVIAQREKNTARDLARTALASSLLEAGETTRASLVALEIRRPEKHVRGIATFNNALAASVATATFEQASRAVLSPDGQRVLSTWMSRFVQIREVQSGRGLRLVGHQDRVHAAAFSPDGTRVVTAAADHTARIWDAETGRRLLFLVGHRDEVVEARFSADGTRVLTLSKDQTARLWSAETGALIVALGGYGQEIDRAFLSPDGRRVVTRSEDGVARLFDTATGAAGVDLPEREAIAGEAIAGSMVAAAFSPEGTHLLIASKAGDLRFFDAAAGEERFVLDGAPGPISAVAFSPTGRYIAAASADLVVRIWDTTTREPPVALRGHGEKVVSIAFSPDGDRLLTASFDRTARLWDARSGAEILVLRGHADRLRSAALSSDGRRVLTVTRDAVARVWDLVQDGGEVAILSGHEDTVYRARFSPDGKQIVTASADGTARIWDVATRQTVHLLSRHTREVLDAAFSPQGERVVTASADGTARLWSTRTGEELMVARGHRREVSGAVFSRNGERFFTVSADATVRIWSATSGEEIAAPIPLRSAARSVAILPDGSLVVRTTPGAQWIDPTTRRQIRRFTWGLIVALRPDGSRYVRRLKNDRRVVRISTHPFSFPFSALKVELAGHQGSVLEASFSPGGGRVITVSEDRTARIWSVASGDVLAVLSGHRESVVGASFSPDGTWVVTASQDHTARLWHVPEGDSRVLRSRLRARTRDCLPKDFRVTQLGEDYVTAVLSEAACKQCVPIFFDSLRQAPRSAIETHVDAWDVYRECLERER
ncbi:MAG: hypothetical protein AAF560_16515 [Acidobacteriota bacterium]